MNTPIFTGRRLLLSAALAAGLGGLLLLIGLFTDRSRAALAYLAAFVFVVSLALGALVFQMVVRAMDAKWPVSLRRLTEASIATFPLLLVLSLPLFLSIDRLYPWAHPERIEDLEMRRLVELKRAYLNTPYFVLRGVLFLLFFAVLGELLRRLSYARDAKEAEAQRLRGRYISAAALPVVGIALTFAAFDWMMSLDPTWYSSVFGIYYFAGGFLGSLALLTLLTTRAMKSGLLPGVGGSHLYALGRLLLTFVIFWAYIAFFQYLLIWIANKPVEVEWYVRRIHGGWRGLAVAIIFGHFAVPFFSLLFYGLKWNRRLLALLSIWMVVMHYLDLYWVVVPSHLQEGLRGRWLDLGALLFVGGLSVIVAVLRLRGRALLPEGDALLEVALRYRSQ